MSEVAVVIKVEPYGGSDVRQHEVLVGRELHGQRRFSTLGYRFKSKARANYVAAFLAAQYVDDGCKVIVVGPRGRERVLNGS